MTCEEEADFKRPTEKFERESSVFDVALGRCIIDPADTRVVLGSLWRLPDVL
jgi:hypothetical protein